MDYPPLGIRLYQVGEGEAAWFAITSELHLVYATRDYVRAIQRYAQVQGVDPTTVAGPTHCADEEQELAERLTLVW
jgi:hypothetical protein